jgi:transposase
MSSFIDTISLEIPKKTQSEIARLVSNVIGDGRAWDQSTISRWLKHHKISDHRINFISALLDEEERSETFAQLAPYATHHLHNFDESSCAREKFIAKIARCHVGEVPTVKEWHIIGADGRVYSVIADYSTEGWTCWRIFLCNINHVCVEQFLQEDLSKVIGEGDLVIHDRASIHMVESTQALLEQITNGHHTTVASYSHDLSPVERGFASTWAYIHRHFDPTIHNPIDILNEAFSIYSVIGPLGYKARNHWNLYDSNRLE